MKLAARILFVLGLGSVFSYGSTVTGVGNVIGTSYTVTGFDSGQKGQEMLGMVVTATFTTGTATCTFVNTGTCTGSGFSVVVTPPTSQTHSADWIITNAQASGSGIDILSLSMNGFAALTPAGTPTSGNVLTAFNPCAAGSTGGLSNCSTIQTTSGGTTTATGAATYANALHLSGQSPQMDLFSVVTVVFSGSFAPTQTFQFKLDTDGVTTAFADVPEPSTLTLFGAGLLALGVVQKRLRK